MANKHSKKWEEQLKRFDRDEKALIRKDIVNFYAPLNWDDKAIGSLILSNDIFLKKLAVFDIPEDYLPPHDLPEAFQNTVFIARLGNGKTYIVNTSDERFCKYVVRASVVPPPSLSNSFHFSMGVDNSK